MSGSALTVFNNASTAISRYVPLVNALSGFASAISPAVDIAGATTLQYDAAQMIEDEGYLRAYSLREQGDLTFDSVIAEASRVRTEANQYQAAQTMKYAMSGVSIQGTPMLALDYTSKQSGLEVNALVNKAANTKRVAYLNAALAEGQNNARATLVRAKAARSAVSAISKLNYGSIFESTGSLFNATSSLFGGSLYTSPASNNTSIIGGLDASYSTSDFA